MVNLQTGLNAIFAAGQDFSLAFWWKVPTIEFTEVYDYILVRPVTFEYLTNGKDGSANAIRFGYRRPVDNMVLSKLYDNSNDGLWHHYAVVRKGSFVRLWRDGVEGFSDTHENNSGSFVVAQMYIVAHNTDRYCAQGVMDDFRLYSRALGEEDIQELNQDAGVFLTSLNLTLTTGYSQKGETT